MLSFEQIIKDPYIRFGAMISNPMNKAVNDFLSKKEEQEAKTIIYNLAMYSHVDFTKIEIEV